MDFLPSVITLLMTWDTSFDPYMGSGSTGRIGCCGAARHYRAFAPYCERAFFRSVTPAASSVPRTTL